VTSLSVQTASALSRGRATLPQNGACRTGCAVRSRGANRCRQRGLVRSVATVTRPRLRASATNDPSRRNAPRSERCT
jgi:hypothetical protein